MTAGLRFIHFDCVKKLNQITAANAGYAHVGQVWHGKNQCGTAFNLKKQMTSDANRLRRPGAAAQSSAAKTDAVQYCQVIR
jgi:hypothetical protein